MRLPRPAAGMMPHMLRLLPRAGLRSARARADASSSRARCAEVCSVEDPLAGRRADAARARHRTGRARRRVLGWCSRDQDLAPGSKNASSPSQVSERIGAPQAAASNSRPDGHQPIAAMALPRDVERQPRRGIEGRMLGGRQVADEVDVRASRGNPAGYCAPPIRKRRSGPRRGRLDEQALERRLPVGGVGAEIGQVGAESRLRAARAMHGRIDVAVERRDPARAEPASAARRARAAGVAQHEVEVARGRAGRYRRSARRVASARQRHGRVEIVEDAQRRGAAEHDAGRREPSGQ